MLKIQIIKFSLFCLYSFIIDGCINSNNENIEKLNYCKNIMDKASFTQESFNLYLSKRGDNSFYIRNIHGTEYGIVKVNYVYSPLKLTDSLLLKKHIDLLRYYDTLEIKALYTYKSEDEIIIQLELDDYNLGFYVPNEKKLKQEHKDFLYTKAHKINDNWFFYKKKAIYESIIWGEKLIKAKEFINE